MSNQELTIILIISGCVMFGILSYLSKKLKKVTDFLKFFRNLVQLPFSWIGKKLMTAMKNLSDRFLPPSVKNFSETRLKPWGGLGTVILFALVTLTNIIVIIVALCSPNLGEKLSDFFMNTALFSFVALIEPILDGSFNMFSVAPMCEVGLTACLTMLCMKNCDELRKGVQILYISLFTLFSSFIGYLIPNSLVQFISKLFTSLAQSTDSTFLAIVKIILVVILVFVTFAIGLVAITEYVAMLRYSLIISGVLLLVIIIGDMLFPKVFEVLVVVLFLPAVVGAEFWRYKMAEKDGI